MDLFSGIGGFALACQWAGIETIGFVEIDKYCQKVLRKHWPDVPIVEDIRDVEAIKRIVANPDGGLQKQSEGQIQTRGNISDGISTSAIKEIVENARCQHDAGQLLKREYATALCQGATITPQRPDCTPRNCVSDRERTEPPTVLVTAGFPCQPFSVAGRQLSQGDNRYLWPQTFTVIEAIRPQWVLLENVAGIIPLALDTVLSDLESADYSWETVVIPACAVNAWHRRDRVWIVANSKGTRTWQDNGRLWERVGGIDGGQESVIANSSINGLERQKSVCEVRQSSPSFGCSGSEWWAVEPELGRVAHGVPNRVDRLKCLGNAIVPQVAYEIIKAIKEVDMELNV